MQAAIDTDVTKNISGNAPALTEDTTEYFKKLNSFLDLLDDEQKRKAFVKLIANTVENDILNIDQLKQWFFYILKLSIIVCLYYVIKRLGLKMIAYQIDIVRKNHDSQFSKENKHQSTISTIETFATLFKSLFTWAMRIIFALMFLTALGFNVNPLVYSVSFLGLGISFASQGVIKDFINGVLNILDGSIAVGEIIQTGVHRGLVEHLTLRSVYLRYSTGELVVIPFSNISDIINYSRHFSKIRADFIIAANQEMEPVRHAIEAAFAEFKKAHGHMILEEALVVGIARASESGSHIFAQFKAKTDPFGRFRTLFHTMIHEQMIKHHIRRIDASNEYILAPAQPLSP
ncbi:MAG: mechanosensitive ion channel [Alphaproteobacteria bacterium]|nr:mechanosensitive ion channel [Alphaproteobacteria bacterium]